MKAETPFISIVLVCYNYAHLLYKALDAISEQTYKDFELVFVDNGCTDNSVEVLKEFMDKNPDIAVKLVTVEKNIGPANGDNQGSKAATGKYLLFHDADDWMDKDTLKILAETAMETDADRVIGTYRSVSDEGKVVHVQTIPENPSPWAFTMQQANLFRNEFYKANNIQISDSLWLDAEKTLRFNHYAKKVAYVKTPIYNYLVHLDSTSKNKNLHENMWSDRCALEGLLKNVKKEYKDADENEMRELEYGMIFTYYSYIMQFLRNAPLKMKIDACKKLRVIMTREFPNYLNNKKLSLFWKGGKSKKARLIVRILSICEKLHLMWLVMFLYHIASKVVYFHAS